MNNDSRFQTGSTDRQNTVSFAERFQASDQFDAIFKEGMALVQRAANYLDGDGRRESKGLESALTVLYATESMRLTTRLLDLASWLLIRRALKDGEITEDEARLKRTRVKLHALGRPAHTPRFDDLPNGLRGLIKESFALHDRIVQIDHVLMASTAEPEAPALNPVVAQILQLSKAFANGR
jgi:regulator of CtrA degradation